MQELCDLKVHVNGQHTFFLDQKIVSTFSGRLRRMIKQENVKTQTKKPSIKINRFPGGPQGFEMATRFCYNNGTIPITPSNIGLLHCSAIFLEMTEEFSICNLLQQTETFLQGLFYWSWPDIMESLKACESFFSSADSSGLLQKLISSLLSKINANSDVILTASSSSSCSSPETPSNFRFSSSAKTPDSIKPYSSKRAPWWFDDLTTLPPKVIGNVVKAMSSDSGTESSSLVLTKFLLHYLKTALRKKNSIRLGSEYGLLADIAVDGVASAGQGSFSCRGLFWIWRLVTGVGSSRECRIRLESSIGGILDQATLDDLLVSGHDEGVYDVNLVLRLIRVFVNGEGGMCLKKLKKVGRLIDKYMGEISPDQSLKVSKFLAVAESLPDSARDWYDGVYRALDTYIESHPMLHEEERTMLCRCLNYEKLTLEACKYLAKSPKIPPKIAIQALVSQQSKMSGKENEDSGYMDQRSEISDRSLVENEEMRLNLLKMQCRVTELEKVCREMRGQMSKIVKDRVVINPVQCRSMPKLC